MLLNAQSSNNKGQRTYRVLLLTMRAFSQWCNIIVSLQCDTICSCVESYVAIIHISTATVRNSLSEIKGKRSRIVPCYSSHEVIDIVSPFQDTYYFNVIWRYSEMFDIRSL